MNETSNPHNSNMRNSILLLFFHTFEAAKTYNGIKVLYHFQKKNENWDPLKNNKRIINNIRGIFHENYGKIFIFLLDLYGNFWSYIFCQNAIHNHKTLLHFTLLYLMVTVYWFLIEWEANENWFSIIDDNISTLFQKNVAA